MAKLVLEEGEEREYLTLPADSIVALKVDRADLSKEFQGRNGPYRRMNFDFTIQGILVVGDGVLAPERYQPLVGSKITGSTPSWFDMTNGNRLRQWVEAILGMPLSIGFELDTDLLAGRRCRGVTKIWTGTQVDSFTGQPKTGHDIAALLPLSEGPMAAPDPWAGYQQRPQLPPQTVAPVAPQYAVPQAAPNPWPQPAPAQSAWGDEPPPF